MKSRVIVVAVIEKGRKILLGRKAVDTGPYPNTWLIPGGGINLGEESAVDAIKREIKEETGLKVEKIEKLGFDEDYEPDKHGEMTQYVILIFKVTPTNNQVVAGDDLKALQWFKESELKGISISRPTVKLFREMGLL